MCPSAAEPAAPARPHAGWSGPGFGLRLSGDFPVHGLGAPAGGPAGGGGEPAVSLHRAGRAELTARWPAGAERISAVRDPSGRTALAIDRHPAAGHLLTGRGYGCFHVDPEAATVRCAPVRAPAWRWQRYLIGQVLPFVAGLHGRELLHAGAVVAGGRALAVTGPSGVGKTTLIAHLVAGGARFLADDTLALEPRGAAVLAHPGPALAVLRPDAAAALPAGLGERVGADADEVALALDGVHEAVALGAIAFLERAERGGEYAIERLAPDDPRPLLAAAYDAVRRDPARLLAQLDVMAQVARSVALLRVRIPEGAAPAAVAAALAAAAREAEVAA